MPGTLRVMDIGLGGRDDLPDLARLLWQHAAPEEQARQSVEEFAVDLGAWWTAQGGAHHAFVARATGGALIGMAWLAVVPRVPRPGDTTRCSADVQSVFVLPEERGSGVGAALVEAATQHAFGLGAGRVTVHSGRRARPVYERLGFASSPELLQRAAD